MNIHEYQAKENLARAGLNVLRGKLCLNAQEAVEAAREFGLEKTLNLCAIKAQIHAGGRGKAGGVKLARSLNEVQAAAAELLGKVLVTPQTGPQGKLVRKVYLECGCGIEKEFYLALLVNRSKSCISIVCSSQGGMEIESLAESAPEKVFNIDIDPIAGMEPQSGALAALKMGIEESQREAFIGLLQKLYSCFLKNDLSLLEINPLVLAQVADSQLMAASVMQNSCAENVSHSHKQFVILDAKISIDDNALFRHAELEALRDFDEQDERDTAAGKIGVSYVGLEGSIGCMVNGAGLAMATMDIIQSYGAKPANFLDVGGAASKESVSGAFKLLLSDKRVKGILINIFGGIVRCDVVANGIVEAARELQVKVPLVVRLLGTHVDEGRRIMHQSGLGIIAVDTMDEAAQTIVRVVSEQSK